MARNLEVKATTKYHHQISIGRADPRKWIFYYLVFWLRVFEGFIGPEGFFSKLLSLFAPYVTSVNFHFFAVLLQLRTWVRGQWQMTSFGCLQLNIWSFL